MRCEECNAPGANPAYGLCPECIAKPQHDTSGGPGACRQAVSEPLPGLLRCKSCGWEGGR